MTHPTTQPEESPEVRRRQLAIDLLEFGMNDLLTDRAFTPGQQIAELTVIGLYFKILAGLESVIRLAETGLPTFALIREMVEALVSTAYIAAADSAERGNLYRDFLAVSRWKEAKTRATHPELKDTVSVQQLKTLEEARDLVISRRGLKTVEDMMNPMKWKTWGGKLSVRKMAKAAGLSDVTYLLAYAWPSQIIHGLDADRYFEVTEDGTVHPARPGRPEAAFLPAASVALVAMEVVDMFLHLGKKEAVLAIKAKIDQMVRAKAEE